MGLIYWIGSIIALFYIAFFYTLWILFSLLKPVLCLCLVCLMTQPQATMAKLTLMANSASYLLYCNDKKWEEPLDDPQAFFPARRAADTQDTTTPTKRAQFVEKKRIVFVRHGESTWNDSFNKGERSTINFLLYFIPNLIYAIAVECYFFVSGKVLESWFYDSPLNKKGVGQALGFQKYLKSIMTGNITITDKEKVLIDLLLANECTSSTDGSVTATTPSSQIVSSNLRRAISTIALALQDRLKKNLPQDKILILPALQEVSRNPDALSITPPQKTVQPCWLDRQITSCDLGHIYSNQMDTTQNYGNKPVDSNGLKRLNQFCETVFSDEIIQKDNVIVCGHSIWFRSFFKTFLPRGFGHVAKRKKLMNGGCVSFILMKTSTEKGDMFMIDPQSIKVVYRGFA